MTPFGVAGAPTVNSVDSFTKVDVNRLYEQ